MRVVLTCSNSTTEFTFGGGGVIDCNNNNNNNNNKNNNLDESSINLILKTKIRTTTKERREIGKNLVTTIAQRR
jgi:hypothetical protein